MNTQITTVLVSVSLMLAVLLAIPAMTAVYAGGDDDDGCKTGSGKDHPVKTEENCPPGLAKKSDDDDD